ncbi:hypothetical protein [Phenylobacterium sp.]|uniref:hypothetical protein n=1 Tax=Phenylobacterium sp. TaxID=1871053 RepID=UPI00272FD18F|nr:hypothetical protein [Phenylobacterium sp.]MDP1873628.1 hypothetical protein [Phenylobacterium sp.]
MTRGILGLKGQGMGRIPSRPSRYQVSFNAPTTAGNQTWLCPKTGLYTVYAWGPGGKGEGSGGNFSGSTGALAIWQRVRFQVGDVVTIGIPERDSTSGDTTVTTARKSAVLTGGRGGDGTGVVGAVGVALNGDININGSAGKNSGTGNNGGGTDGGLGSSTSAPGAPGYDGFRGGDGATIGYPAGTPAAGGMSTTGGDPQQLGGCGLVIICRDA